MTNKNSNTPHQSYDTESYLEQDELLDENIVILNSPEDTTPATKNSFQATKYKNKIYYSVDDLVEAILAEDDIFTEIDDDLII